MTQNPAEPAQPGPPADGQDQADPTPPADADGGPEVHTAAPSDNEPVHRETRRPFVVAREGTRAVILRDGRRIELEPTMVGPNGAEMPRCQGIAIRLDADPSGAAAGQCSKPAVSGVRVCPTHGASAPQVIAAARRRLQGSTLSLVDRLLAIAEDPTAKDSDALRAIDSALDRAGIPRRTEVGIDEAQVRRDIADRLAALDVPTADPDTTADPESPGEEPTDEDPSHGHTYDTSDLHEHGEEPPTPSTEEPT